MQSHILPFPSVMLTNVKTQGKNAKLGGGSDLNRNMADSLNSQVACTRSCVYKNENSDQQYWSNRQSVEPCPRFAHQLAYDHVHKRHYLFGGNPGRAGAGAQRSRLDDFWSLEVSCI